MRWFGPTWDAPVNEETEEVPTPEEQRCLYCRQPIIRGERGVMMPTSDGVEEVAVHLHCFTKAVIGR